MRPVRPDGACVPRLGSNTEIGSTENLRNISHLETHYNNMGRHSGYSHCAWTTANCHKLANLNVILDIRKWNPKIQELKRLTQRLLLFCLFVCLFSRALWSELWIFLWPYCCPSGSFGSGVARFQILINYL